MAFRTVYHVFMDVHSSFRVIYFCGFSEVFIKCFNMDEWMGVDSQTVKKDLAP
jgi:hypothetical protein